VISEGWRAYAATLLPALLPALPPDVGQSISPEDANALALLARIEQAALAEAEFVMHARAIPAGAAPPDPALRLAEVTGWSPREVERALQRIALAPGEASAGFFGMQSLFVIRATRETDGRGPFDAVRLAAFHTETLRQGRRTIESLLRVMRPSQPERMPERMP
jgi:hypothetical protein